MELDTLRDLYVDELKDLYSAEKQLVKALPKLAKAATNTELKRAITEHLHKTEGHVQRLEKILADMDMPIGRVKKCVGMEGIIEEGNELIQERPDKDVLDAGLISKSQHVEHYEIAGYGTVVAYAQELGEKHHTELLKQTLDEEKEADRLLTKLAESAINLRAHAGRAD